MVVCVGRYLCLFYPTFYSLCVSLISLAYLLSFVFVGHVYYRYYSSNSHFHKLTTKHNSPLLFVPITQSGAIKPPTTNPISGQGARFVDTNHEHRPDLLARIVEDGGSDDSQATPDGFFNLSAVAAVAEAVVQLQRLGDGLVVADQGGHNLPVATHAPVPYKHLTLPSKREGDSSGVRGAC